MADYPITITEKDILGADSYIGISTKEVHTRAIAFACLEPVRVEMDDDGNVLPTMFRENKKIKAQYLMGVLATLLKRPFESEKLKSGEELTGCMAEAEYDRWAQSHVMNQLERLKKALKNSEAVNKLFDLLYEYKAIELMLTGAIKDELEVRNDPFNRAMQWFTLSAADAGVKEIVKMAVSEAAKGDD